MSEVVQIKAPNIITIVVPIQGTAPLVMNKFSRKARQEMMDKQKSGAKAVKGKARAAKDFDACFEAAIHYAEDGWIGLPANAIRSAMIAACRLVGFKMTVSKQAVFIEADGFDRDEGTPLVKLLAGKPEKHEACVRNQTGVADVRVRPMWRKWNANIGIKYDADMFSKTDVVNLLQRAGMQVGICEGRPASKSSHGMGWGTFEIVTE